MATLFGFLWACAFFASIAAGLFGGFYAFGEYTKKQIAKGEIEIKGKKYKLEPKE